MSVFRLSENETDPGAAADAGGGVPAAEPAATEPEGEEWSAPSRDDWESTQSTLAELQERIEFQQQYLPQAAFQQQQPQGQSQEPQAPPAPDPFSDNYAAELASYVQYQAQQAVQPYQQAAQTWQEREGEQRAQDMIHDDISRNGDFVNADQSTKMINGLADAYYNAILPTVGPNGAQQAASQAYENAIRDVRAYEKALADAGAERYKNQLSGLDPRRQQIPASGDAATQTFPAPGGGDEMDLVRRYTGGQGLPV